jgi:hypothetical protein
MSKIQQLQQFAMDNYEAGGHWVVECWDAADYNQVLEDCGGDVEAASAAIQQQWELTNEQERNCAWGAAEDMDGDFDSAMASAGYGTDEDYGYAEDAY